jgi:hypothetical protein
MSADSGPPGAQPVPPVEQPVPAMTCRVCEAEIPAGAFCGLCGAHRTPPGGRGGDGLRIHTYGAAPGEHLLRLSVVSSLFPHLPHRSRTAFRVGLAALVVLLGVLAVLQWQAPLIAVAALGFPLLFQVYLQESDVYDDLSVRELLPTAVLGAALGVGWALLTGPIVARSSIVGIGAGAGMSAQQVLVVGLAIPLGGALVMLVPAALARVVDPSTRESLDGFLIGALGAIAFTAASTVTLLEPQLATGVVALTRPVRALLIEALIEGVAVPLTAAAAGGLVGAALWFTRRTAAAQPRRGPALLALAASIVVVLVVYAGLGLIGVARWLPAVQACLHLLIAAVAVLALRIGLHAALLNEVHEHIHGEPLLCVHCRHVIPDLPFCPNCGVAIRASSRSSRAARRAARPVPTDTSRNT